MLKQRIVCILMTLVLILCAAPAVFADELSDQQAKVTELQTKVNETNQRVNELNSQIAQKTQEIEQTQTELDAAEARRAGQQTALEQRLRAMYMYGNDGYIEMIFSSKSFDEIITYTDVSADIIEADRKTQTDLTDTKKEIAEKEQKLKDDKAAIEQAKAESEAVQLNLSTELAQNKALVEETLQKLAAEDPNFSQSAYYNSGEAGYVLGSNSDSGWVWPIDASATNAFMITSLMGTRSSPGGVGSTDHGGTDIAAKNGSIVVAVQDAVVSSAGVNSGYGNCVVLTTTDGYTVYYGHLSSIGCYQGQSVSKGQSLGNVGSTGWSTGPHLHFEVRLGNSKINGLSFYGNDVLARLTYNLDA